MPRILSIALNGCQSKPIPARSLLKAFLVGIEFPEGPVSLFLADSAVDRTTDPLPIAPPGSPRISIVATLRFVIVGNGVAGTEAALTLRRRLSPKEATITLISDESPYFFSRTALMYAYMERLQRRDLEPYERAVYDRQNIERILARVVDLNATEQAITLSDGRQLPYDRLLLATGACPRMVPFPGVDQVKEGLVHFVSLQDLDHCESLTWSTREAVVVGGGLIGVELAEAFHHHGLKVTFLVREPYFWPAALHQEEGEMVTAHLRERGIEVCHQEEIQQIHVDEEGRVRALDTSQNRTLAAQMLGICIGVTPNIEWLHSVETPPEVARGLRVDRGFRTSLENVYAAGDCAEIVTSDGSSFVETIWYSARLHGELAARSMLGDSIEYRRPTFYNSSKFFEIEYTTVGQVQDLPAGTRSLFRWFPGKKISQRILSTPEGRVLGFNMLGSRWDHTILIRWLEQRRSLDFVRDHLRQAQFDHEFGRAPLEKMQEKESVL